MNLSSPWLVRFEALPAPRLRLVCCHHAGASASVFRTWAGHLAPDIEVVAIQLPGREQRFLEEPVTDWPSLMVELVGALDPFLSEPLALFGLSMGALIGFELARAMEARSVPVAHLFTSGYRAPDLPDRKPPMAPLADDEFLRELRARYGEDSLPDDEELEELLLPIVREDMRLCETYEYRPGPPLSTDVTVIAGRRDDTVSAEELAGWERHTRGGFAVRTVDADHRSIVDHQDGKDLVKRQFTGGRGSP